MSEIIKVLPLELVVLTLILVVMPTIIAIFLRHALYRYLISSANRVSRLLTLENRGQQPEIVRKLEQRFEQASKNLEQVNTIALIDGLYGQEKLKFLGMSLRCEQWDYFCRTVPNLLLAFGLLGTFIGISFNLYSLSQTISQTGTNADDLNYLISQIQIPLRNMGIAFFSSLIAIACSSILTGVNLRCNTNFAKSLLISSLEDYLDNIYKIEVQGDTRLDKAVDKMVRQQEEFLERFHIKVGQVLETTIGNAANRMVDANQGFQNNVDSMVSRFSDITQTMGTSTRSFQEATEQLKTDIQTVSEILPKFTSAANKVESGSNIYLQGAEKIEASRFSEHLESLTADLATTQQSFSESTVSLRNQVHKLAETQQQTAELAQQVYTQLDTASTKLEDSSISFTEAAETFSSSDFADKLTTATNELVTIPQQFKESTTILHQSTSNLEQAIGKINTVSQNTNSLIESTKSLNQKSTELLEKSDRNIQQEITSLKEIKDELSNIVDTLNQHKSQINTSMSNFGEKILTSFQTQTNSNVVELQKLTSEIKNNSSSLNSNLNGIGITSERLLKSFESGSQNNTKEIQNLIKEFKQTISQIDNIPLAIKKLINEFEKHEKQMNSNLNSLNNNI
ncbi:MAG: hypothetical protein AAFY63_16480 [Cyanobacteria bacterium J06643_13]